MTNIPINWTPKNDKMTHANPQENKIEAKVSLRDATETKVSVAVHEAFDNFPNIGMSKKSESFDLDLSLLEPSIHSDLDEIELLFDTINESEKIIDDKDLVKKPIITDDKKEIGKLLSEFDKKSVEKLFNQEIERQNVFIDKIDQVLNEKEFKAFLPIDSGKSFEQISLKQIAQLPEQLQKTAFFATMRDGKIQINQEQHHKLKEHLHDGELKIKDEKGNIKSMSVTLMTPEEEIEFQKLLKLKNRYVRIVQVRARLLLLQQKVEKQSPNDFSAHVHNIIHNLQYVSAPNFVHKKVRHCIEKFVKKLEINRENDQKRHLEKMIEKKKIEAYERAKQYEKTEQKKNAKAQKRLDTDISKEEIAKGLANEELKEVDGRKTIKHTPVQPQKNSEEITPIPGQVPKKASSIIL